MPSTISTSSRSRGYAFASIESSIGPIYSASLRHGTTIDTKGRTTDPEALVTLLMGAWPASGLIMPRATRKGLATRDRALEPSDVAYTPHEPGLTGYKGPFRPRANLRV